MATVPAPSQTNDAVTSLAAVDPGLHTRAATGKTLGPAVTSLLSRPITSHVSGVTVSCAGAALTGTTMDARRIATAASVVGSRKRRDTGTSEGGSMREGRVQGRAGGDKTVAPEWPTGCRGLGTYPMARSALGILTMGLCRRPTSVTRVRARLEALPPHA